MPMETFKREFIEFMVRSGVLSFGDFVTKSGRTTPYFINTGRYRTGEQATKLGRFYAQAIESTLGDAYDVLFGPAYKGIPLVVLTSIALFGEQGRNVGYCFNRKESKEHGEGGTLVGHPLADGDRVLIVEDVTTAGTSIRETMPLLTGAAKVEVTGLVVSVDRQERGRGRRSAFDELYDEFGIRSFAIVTLDEIVEHLSQTPLDGRLLIDERVRERIDAYRAEYGA